MSNAIPWTLPDAFAAMRTYNQWFIYRLSGYNPASGKFQKTPIDARTGRMAPKDHGGLEACTDWDTVARVVVELQTPAATAAGEYYLPGFYFTAADPFFFLDIDGCLIRDAQGNPSWSPLAVQLLTAFQGAAVEISSSGQGLHIIGTGTAPQHRCKETDLKLEFYTQDRGVVLSCAQASGNAAVDFSGALPELVQTYFQPRSEADAAGEWTTGPVAQWHGPQDDDELVQKALKSNSAKAVFGDGVSFAALWNMDVEKLTQAFPAQSNNWPWDRSSADLSLVNRLAFWTGGNCERMERLWRASTLGQSRDKLEREDYLCGTILKACAWAAAKGKYYNDGKGAPAVSEDGREVIKLTGGELDKNVAKLQGLVADKVYVRGGGLVRIGHAEELSNTLVDSNGTQRAAKQAICIQVSSAWLRMQLMQLATFWRFDKRSAEWELKDCPTEIAETIVKQEGWSGIRPLLAISSVPVLRPDMSVWIQPGYDPETGVFYQPTMVVPDIPAKPTREDALQALARLYEPFNQFPYASPVAASVFLAHVLASVIRTSFDTCPITLYTAPVAGTGKTLLANMASLIANGTTPACSPYSEGEELRKVLFSALLSGDAALTLDNVPNGQKLPAPGLCGFTTAATYSDRILGASENRKLPNRCTVVLTGNNITPTADMPRRSLVCRLDVNAESARGRDFRIKDLNTHVRMHRAQLIVDALTVVRAYALAGRPEVAKPLESFHQWSTLVRDPLVWLGMVDPVASQLTETDDGLEPLRVAFAAIATSTQGQGFTTKQLAQLTVPTLPNASTVDAAKALFGALEEAGCKEPMDTTALGFWLRANKDRVAGPWKLAVDRDRTNTSVWHLKPVAA